MQDETKKTILDILDSQKIACLNCQIGSHVRNIQEAYYRGNFLMAEEILTNGFENDIVLRYNDLTKRHEIIENGEVFIYGNE